MNRIGWNEEGEGSESKGKEIGLEEVDRPEVRILKQALKDLGRHEQVAVLVDVVDLALERRCHRDESVHKLEPASGRLDSYVVNSDVSMDAFEALKEYNGVQNVIEELYH